MSELYEPYDKLISIEVLGRRFEVPENNLLLRQLPSWPRTSPGAGTAGRGVPVLRDPLLPRGRTGARGPVVPHQGRGGDAHHQARAGDRYNFAEALAAKD